MNEKLFRTQFNQMETTEKQALMESLAARYDMTFLGLHTFDRWDQSCMRNKKYIFGPSVRGYLVQNRHFGTQPK